MITFILFVITTAFSAYTMITFGDSLAREDPITKAEKRAAIASVYTSLGSFVLGLITLVAFVLRNLFSGLG